MITVTAPKAPSTVKEWGNFQAEDTIRKRKAIEAQKGRPEEVHHTKITQNWRQTRVDDQGRRVTVGKEKEILNIGAPPEKEGVSPEKPEKKSKGEGKKK